MEGVRVRPADERPAVPARAIGGRRLRRGWSASQGGDACSVSHRPGARRLRACCHERRAVEVQRGNGGQKMEVVRQGARGARAAAARSAGARQGLPASGSRLPAPGSRLPAPGSRLPAPGSRLPAPGSRLPAPGSRLPAPGSRLPAPGSRLPAPGSRLPAPGSRLPAPGSRLPAPGSRLPAPGSRLPAPGSRLPAPGSRLPAPGSRLPAPGSRLPAPGSRLPNFICSYNYFGNGAISRVADAFGNGLVRRRILPGMGCRATDTFFSLRSVCPKMPSYAAPRRMYRHFRMLSSGLNASNRSLHRNGNGSAAQGRTPPDVGRRPGYRTPRPQPIGHSAHTHRNAFGGNLGLQARKTRISWPRAWWAAGLPAAAKVILARTRCSAAGSGGPPPGSPSG